jgi:transglutaminase-like putative cysteine protease
MSSDRRLIVLGPAEDYLRCTDLVDFDDPAVSRLAGSVAGGGETDMLRRSFELVRDRFPHSMDAGAEEVACSASDVARLGHGLCYAKSHLLAALLRHNGIPAGFCYQRFVSERGGFVLHGLNAALVNGSWVRLDARGNNDNVRVAFDTGHDMLAYPADESIGERDYPVVFPRPDGGVIQTLRDGAGKRLSTLALPSDLSCPL